MPELKKKAELGFASGLKNESEPVDDELFAHSECAGTVPAS